MLEDTQGDLMIATSNEREKAESISQLKKRNAGREMSSSQKREE